MTTAGPCEPGRAGGLPCALALALALSALGSAAHAHDVRGSAVYLDIGARVIALEVHLPLAQLALAGAPALAAPAEALSPAEVHAQAAYLRAHLRVLARDGSPFKLELGAASLEPAAFGDPGALVIHGSLRPPAAADPRWLELHFDAIVHRVVTHNAYVFVRRDLATGLLGGAPELVGMMHWQRPVLVIDRAQGSAWQGLVALFRLGVAHIQRGTDHLLFLLLLLLPAPLLPGQRRWAAARGARASLRAIVGIVTAFTLGHSLTLLVGALAGAALPTAAVEILIAVSILVTALHAWRPLFAGRELLLAGGFGLVHGLAFARELLGFGFDGQSLALALLGFNLGIEAMQLAVVALVMPWLMLASDSEHYRWIRTTGAAFGGLAASGWIAERALGLASIVPPLVERVAARAPWLLAGLAVAALTLAAARRLATREVRG